MKTTRRLSFLVQLMQNATRYAAVADMSMLGGVHTMDQALAMCDVCRTSAAGVMPRTMPC